MAKIYRCLNLGDCPKAGQEIQVSDGDSSPVCPECHQPLNCEEVFENSSPRVPKLAIVAGAAIIILSAIGGITYYVMNTTKTIVGDTKVIAEKTERVIQNVVGTKKPVESGETNQQNDSTTEDKSDTKGLDSNNTNPKTEENIQEGKEGISLDDADIKQQQQEGTDDLKKGKADEAEIKNRKAMANQVIKLAVSDMQRKDYKKAEEDLNEAKNLDEDNPLIYYNLALISLERKDIKDALHLFEKCFDKAVSNNYEAKYRNQIFEEIKSGNDLKNFRKTKDGKKLLELLEKYEKK